MNRLQVRALLDQVASGAVTPEAAQAGLLQYLRQSAFEDLGFAKIDHQRTLRQGFPEVVFGQGKTPAQIAAISERIVAAGHSLLVTRTTAEAFAAVVERVPAASFDELARTITLRNGEVAPPRGPGGGWPTPPPPHRSTSSHERLPCGTARSRPAGALLRLPPPAQRTCRSQKKPRFPPK